MTKTSSKGRRDIHIEGHSSFVILNAGASIALGTKTVGNDTESENEGHSVNLGATNVTTPTGFITRGGTNAEAVSVSVTVV